MTEVGLSEEIVLRLKSGDAHAFAEIFALHRARLKRMLELRMDNRIRRREDASDILQEIYLDAHQRIVHYLKRPELSFYVWLRQLTIQRLIDNHRRHLKAQKRSIKHEVPLDQRNNSAFSSSMAIELATQLATPSQMAIQAELIAQIHQALESMDEVDREVLSLRHFEELRNSEVAEALGLKQAAASNRYIRALTRLREALEELPGFAPGSHLAGDVQ